MDVDETIPYAFNVQCMPTFQFFKGAECVSVLEGGDVAMMKQIINSYV